jgi:hypothetical protein
VIRVMNSVLIDPSKLLFVGTPQAPSVQYGKWSVIMIFTTPAGVEKVSNNFDDEVTATAFLNEVAKLVCK